MATDESETAPTAPKRQAAVSLVVELDDEQPTRMLCVYNCRYDGWSLPGGMVEDGETPEQAQRRELEEETGMLTEHARLVFSGEHNIKAKQGAARPGRGSIVNLFIVQAAGEPREMEEGCPIQWMTLDEFLAGSPFAELYAAVLPPILLKAQQDYDALMSGAFV